MNGPELLRIVDAIHRDKGIDKEIVFEGIEQAILSATRKHGTVKKNEIRVQVDPETTDIRPSNPMARKLIRKNLASCWDCSPALTAESR